MTSFLLSLPWLGLLLFERFVARIPGPLPARVDGRGTSPSERGPAPEPDRDRARGTPAVSVVVPARNEAVNIMGCLRSLAASRYPDFEVIVVDDRSDDHTGELARSVSKGNAKRIQVMDGRPLPEGWLGKPWACHQGALQARGEVLLFTDADTWHGPSLLDRAVEGLREEGADLLTVVGRQVMETFWERLVQPHIFFMMLLRFPDFERTARNTRWRDAIANGQFLLFTREAYQRIGGHESVKDEVVEDLALAQQVKRAGLSLRIRSAEDDLATRMYRSLGHLVEGWSKNIVMGGLQSFPRWMRPVVPPVSFVGGVLMWLVAPAVLVAAVLGVVPGGEGAAQAAMIWSGLVHGFSTALWMVFTHRMGAPALYGLVYPLGAGVASFIFLRSWVRGSTVEWKGRRYRVPSASERA